MVEVTNINVVKTGSIRQKIVNGYKFAKDSGIKFSQDVEKIYKKVSKHDFRRELDNDLEN
jgi:phosphomannomutase